MGNVALTVIDGVARHWCIDRNESWNIRESVISHAEQSKVVLAQVILAKAIEFVLLTVLETIEKSIAKRELARDPGICVGIARAPSRHDVGIAVIASELEKTIKPRTWGVRGGDID